MPARAADADAALRPAPDDDGLREALLARVRSATAQAGERLEVWAAELAALEAAGLEPVPPAVEEPWDLGPGPLAAPPDGADAWLADLPGPLLDEYMAATEGPAGPEPIAAGFWSRSAGDGAGFASGGAVDDLPPGPVLAGLTADVCAAGLGRLSDDELIGVLRAGRRLGSWSASMELAAVGELAERRLAEEAAGQTGRAEHADAEVAAALTLTGRAAGQLLDLGITLRRLPLTARALAAGSIDLPRVMAIAEEVAGLGDEHIAGVEEQVLARAASQTTTQVRAAARRAVIAADPAAARQRQERAQRDARVERWTEHAGTGRAGGPRPASDRGTGRRPARLGAGPVAEGGRPGRDDGPVAGTGVRGLADRPAAGILAAARCGGFRCSPWRSRRSRPWFSRSSWFAWWRLAFRSSWFAWWSLAFRSSWFAWWSLVSRSSWFAWWPLAS